jgi:hypothetical protein
MSEDSSQSGADGPRQVDIGSGDEVQFVAELTAVEYAGAYEEAIDDEPEVWEAAGKELGQGQDLRFLRRGELDEEMVFAFARAMNDGIGLQAFLQDLEGFIECGVGGGGPGLFTLAVLDDAAGQGLGFHQDVEHAEFPFGRDARAGEDEALAVGAVAAMSRAAGDVGKGALHIPMVGGRAFSTQRAEKSRGGVVPRLRPLVWIAPRSRPWQMSLGPAPLRAG